MHRRFVAVVTAVVVTVGGCSAGRDDAGATPGLPVSSVETTAAPIRSLAIIGDSITNGSEVELRERLSDLDVDIMAIDAEDGRRMTSAASVASGADVVAQLSAGQPPDLWVIALGTNDVGHYDGAENYAPAIEELLAAVPADAPLVWVDVYLESIPTASAEFNATLRRALRDRGHAAVVAWADLADEDGVLRDGIHPSGYGIEQWSELVTAAVSTWVS